MKQLKKVQLLDAKELTPKQMKDIAGGDPSYGSDCDPSRCTPNEFCVIRTPTRPYSGRCTERCVCDTTPLT